MNNLDPLLVEMLRRVPPPGTVWPAPERKAWLEAMWAIFRLVYGPAPDIIISDVSAEAR